MPAKSNAKNPLIPLLRAVDALGGRSHFPEPVEDGRLVPTPAQPRQADAVRQHIALLGLSQADVTDAVAWARHTS